MNNLFFLVKGFIKKLVRYCFSFYWFFRIKLRNHGGSTNSAIKKNLGNVVDVHLICPGPGIRKINEMKIDDKTLLIFVNHAVEVSCDDKFKNVPKIAFSADPVRALEILEQRKDKLSCCTSILLPGHLFQMNYKIYNSYDFVLTPSVTISSLYGLVCSSEQPKYISSPQEYFVSYGFGSLVAALTLSLLSEPKKIRLWGCDFGEVNGKEYGVNNVPVIGTIPHQEIRETIEQIISVLSDQGIDVVMHVS